MTVKAGAFAEAPQRSLQLPFSFHSRAPFHCSSRSGVTIRFLSQLASSATTNQLPQQIWNRSNRTSLNGCLEG
ncbi:hypothetical protein ACC702_39250, partial [Rhizobium ruizarguesonis]